MPIIPVFRPNDCCCHQPLWMDMSVEEMNKTIKDFCYIMLSCAAILLFIAYGLSYLLKR